MWIVSVKCNNHVLEMNVCCKRGRTFTFWKMNKLNWEEKGDLGDVSGLEAEWAAEDGGGGTGCTWLLGAEELFWVRAMPLVQTRSYFLGPCHGWHWYRECWKHLPVYWHLLFAQTHQGKHIVYDGLLMVDFIR